MYSIEKILNDLSEKGMDPMILIVKANEGYSAVHFSKEDYSPKLLMEPHYNEVNVLKAVQNLYTAIRRRRERNG